MRQRCKQPAFCPLEYEDRTFLVWYRYLYAPRTGGAYDSHHRKAGIAGRTRRRGGRVAARRARAADDAGDRVPERPLPSVTAHPTSDHSAPWLSFGAALIRGLTVISIS